MKLVAPNGKPIIALLEHVETFSLIENPRPISGTGLFDFDFSEQFLCDQRRRCCIMARDHRVFIDEDGSEWLERELRLEEL